MTGRIMVVDDDVALAEMIGIVLTSEGYQPDYCVDGTQALTLIRQLQPDLVLLDLMLPGMDGIEVCRELRKESGVPVIMVTAKSDTKDIVQGLEVGADDYILKPFKPAELVARIKARLRQPPATAHRPAKGDFLRIGDVEINVPGHEVHKAGELVPLTPLEFDILEVLASKPWQVFSRDMLLERVWGYENAADTRLVNVHVQRLRSKLESDLENPVVILTIRGVGYKAGSPR
ncbi:MAG: response regulator transcription factor [Bifidobacteriaceae bacterium]|jgi:two-component system response regulator MtrA|nr:response regulator transcription factor [Bifidobacteriaceae bacterium]